MAETESELKNRRHERSELLYQKILKGLNGRVPVDAKEDLGRLKHQKDEIFLKYSWIKDERFLSWVLEQSWLEIFDGEFGMTIRISHG